MPVNIPPFANVPAPGDPITSPWANQLTQYVVDGKRLIYHAQDFTGGQSADVGATAVVVTSCTVPVKAGRVYEIRGSMQVVHVVAGVSGGAQMGLSVPGTDIAAADIYLNAANVSVWTTITGYWLPGADNAAAVIQLKVVKSWWSAASAIRYAKGPAMPIGLSVHDCGKYP
jgi:hypothetical protein